MCRVRAAVAVHQPFGLRTFVHRVAHHRDPAGASPAHFARAASAAAISYVIRLAMRKRGGGATLRGAGGLAPDVVHDGGRRDGEAVFAGRERSYE